MQINKYEASRLHYEAEISLNIHEIIGLSNETEFFLFRLFVNKWNDKNTWLTRRVIGSRPPVLVFDAAKRIQGNKYKSFGKRKDRSEFRFYSFQNYSNCLFILSLYPIWLELFV